MSELTAAQLVTRLAIWSGASGGLCVLLWVGSTWLKRCGLIVPRETPPEGWAEFAEATDDLARAVRDALRLDQVVAWLARRLTPRRDP